MAESYSLDTFAPHVGTPFNVTNVQGGFTIQLATAEPGKAYEGQPREHPFVLTFTGPPDAILPQHSYTLQHDALGTVEIFLVPVGPERPGGDMRYEAIFN